MKNFHRSGLIFIIGTFLLGIILFMIFTVFAKSPQSPTVSIGTNVFEQNEIDELKAALESETLKPGDRSRLEAKLVFLEREATRQAEPVDVSKNWSDKQTAIVQETRFPKKPSETEVRPTGLITDPSSIGVSREDKFATVWVELKGAQTIQIFTGFALNNPEQGVILVRIVEPDSITRILTPGKTGSLAIVGAEGAGLLIEAKNGKSYIFNYNDDTFQLTDVETGEVVVETTNQMTPGVPYPTP